MADNGHDFITTFFSHYGAMRYKKKCDEYQIKAKLMPVPRNLSSSCGTCVGSDRLAENVLSDPSVTDEIEQIFVDYYTYYSENKEDPVLEIINSYWEA